MKYILAIGNYGKEYEKTYHSLGLLFANVIIQHFQPVYQKENKTNIFIQFEKFNLIISKTYMNHSFDAIKEDYMLKKIEKLLVLHDELMLARFKLRIKTTQGNAGHNGLRNISQYIKEYDRLQIGIDHPKNFNPNFTVSDYVLSQFDDQNKWIEIFKTEGIKLLNLWIEN